MAELNSGVEQGEAFAVLPPGHFDQDFVAKLGDIDRYQNGGLLLG